MTQPLANPEHSASVEDALIEMGLELSLTLTPSQLVAVKHFATLTSKVDLLRVAEELEREGSYTLGGRVRTRVEKL